MDILARAGDVEISDPELVCGIVGVFESCNSVAELNSVGRRLAVEVKNGKVTSNEAEFLRREFIECKRLLMHPGKSRFERGQECE